MKRLFQAVASLPGGGVRLDDKELKATLGRYKRIAVVGMSKDPEKDAQRIPLYLKNVGYEIIPVNPSATEIAGMKAYKSLSEIPFDFDIVQIFRPSEAVPPIVDEALKTKAKVIWMQLGISNAEAAEKASMAGKIVIQDRCMMVEHRRLIKAD
jgi:predicted CoA-binding protein